MEPEEGMGKRMVTVEVTGTQSSALRSGRAIISKPQDLEDEGAAILKVYAECEAGPLTDSPLMHTTVSGRLENSFTGVLVLEVYPFVVRTSLIAAHIDILNDWVGSVRDQLAAGVHPAPCALYVRRLPNNVEGALPLSGADVQAAAKAILGDIPTTLSTTTALQWSLHIQTTVAKTIKIKKEVEANPSTKTSIVNEEKESSPTFEVTGRHLTTNKLCLRELESHHQPHAPFILGELPSLASLHETADAREQQRDAAMLRLQPRDVGVSYPFQQLKGVPISK